ncbi:hypothetical protein TNCT_347511 [Trichonephila clavata]|uniref:Uncharacterized protein n=1 Tax=Trichonephila clavata TaxID=2740835 RepID=A0A8X6KN61_TRICU|nr:hypothetical protein TNCT_347511 [Trichonephila clavata]
MAKNYTERNLYARQKAERFQEKGKEKSQWPLGENCTPDPRTYAVKQTPGKRGFHHHTNDDEGFSPRPSPNGVYLRVVYCTKKGVCTLSLGLRDY